MTEAALHKHRATVVERRIGTDPARLLQALELDREADAFGADPPDIGAAGEVVNPQPSPLIPRQQAVTKTLRRGAARIAKDASLRRGRPPVAALPDPSRGLFGSWSLFSL